MKKSIFVGVILSLTFPCIAFADSGRSKVKKGNKAFAEGKYDQALNHYQDALLEDPESPYIHFNIGDALYKKKKYEEALKSYQKALSSQIEDVLMQSKIYYNMGNTLYRMGKLPESILSYKRALELNPNDMDAKYNLEFVRNKLKQQTKKQPLQAGQQKQLQQKQKQQQQGQKQQQEQKEKQPPAGRKEQKKQKMSREDAERILDALKNDERKQLQKSRRITSTGKFRVEKDW